jgi:hypothetical protein
MAAVTQKIPSYLGGVSQQAEELMRPGQVLDALNAFPDPALGLVKRTGLEYVSDIRNATATAPIAPTDALRRAKWFPIFLGPGTNFFGVVGDGFLRVFGTDGIERVVNDPSTRIASYLGTVDDLSDVATCTVNEFTFIANRLTVVAQKAVPSFNANRTATVVITEVHYGAQYSLSFNLSGTTTTITYTTFNAEAAIVTPGQTERSVTVRQILVGLQALLPAGYSGTIIGNTMEITRTTGTLNFTCTASGALSGVGLFAFQDEIADISLLPSKAKDGRLVKVINSDSGEDDYYVKFIASSTTIGSGDGYWTEWVSPSVSPGLDSATLPHLLSYDPGTDEFTFEIPAWTDRLVGDDGTNPHPSIFGKTIRSMFFLGNRLGFLTDETIVMSQTNDFYNLYANSAITPIDTDPIDRSVSSQTTVRLSGVHPTPQGLIIFGDNQQFLMEAADGIFTPGSSNIKSISNYQMNPDVSPVDLGITVGFLSTAGAYARFFEFLSRGQNEQPDILELTKILPEWLPNTINVMTSSPQAGVIVLGSVATLAGPGSNDVYVLRYWQDGNTRSQAWTRWELPEPAVMLYLDQETLWVVTDGNRTASGAPDAYPLCRLNLNQQSSADSTVNYTFVPTQISYLGKTLRSEPRVDYWCEIPQGDLVWDGTNGVTRVYLPPNYTPATGPGLAGVAYGLGNCVLTSNPIGTEPDGGFLRTNVPLFQQIGGPLNGRYFATVQGTDLTAFNATVLYGYLYTCAVELPRTYFRTGDDGSQSDYTASLTISRQRFVFGVTGPMQFLLRTRGRANGIQIQPIPHADYYLANTIPMTDSAIFTVPIHQKNDNFSIRIDSPTTFPMTLQSSSWEGNYAPRFYRRT